MRASDVKKSNFDYFLYFVLFGNVLFFIWSNRYLPLQDYPDWVYQGSLFTGYLKGTLSQNYHLLTYPVPYSLVTVVMGFLGLVFQPETAGKIVLTLYAVLFILGSFYLLTCFQTALKRVLLYFPFVFLINYLFFRGTLSYIFGLGILFFCIGYVLRTFLNDRPWNPYFVFASSVVLFFTHGIVYMTWLLFLFVLMIFSLHNKQALKNIIAGSIPSLLLAVAYVVWNNPHTDMKIGHLIGLKPLLLHKSGVIAYLLPLHEFYPFLNPYPNLTPLVLVNLIFFLFLTALFLLWLLKIRECIPTPGTKYLATMVILLMGAYLFVPPIIMNADGVDLRFVYPLLFCFLTSLSQLSLGGFGRGIIKSFLIFIVCVQAVYLDTHVSRISENMGGIMSSVRHYVQNTDFLFIDEAHFKFAGGFKQDSETNGIIENFFIPRHRHLSTLTSLLSLELAKETPIFPVGLFYYDGKKKWITSVQDTENMEIQPEHYVILGGAGGNEVIAETLSADYAVGLKENNFIVMTKR